LYPESGAKADIPALRIWVDTVEKVTGNETPLLKMENFRIRRAGVLNQNSVFGRNSAKIFFSPGAKIVFQQYRSQADMDSNAWSRKRRAAAPRHFVRS
jgi:hypothetical protein